MTLTEATLRVLDDLHSAFDKTMREITPNYDGPAKSAERRILLVEKYGIAVERVLNAAPADLITRVTTERIM